MSSFREWRDRAKMLTPPLPWDRPSWRDHGGERVVLLHGLWRGWRSMDPLARAFGSGGYSTLNIPYASGFYPIHVLAKHLRERIQILAGDGPIYFVTHSLGGILLRQLLAEGVPWKMGRVIMLAPPNHGSEIVDWMRSHSPLHLILGPAGRALGKDGVPGGLPSLPPGVAAAVIMGSRSTLPLFKRLLPAENDGIVSTQSGYMEGLHGFSVIDADHTFIQIHPEAIRMSLHFIQTGEWVS